MSCQRIMTHQNPTMRCRLPDNLKTCSIRSNRFSRPSMYFALSSSSVSNDVPRPDRKAW